MTWFATCDTFARHPKARRAGLHGRALWHITGDECAREDTDGLVDPFMLRDSYAPLTGVPWKKAAGLLVASGLWHDHRSVKDCARCMMRLSELPARQGIDPAGGIETGWHYFHDWHIYQLDKKGKDDQIHRKSELRRKALTRAAKQIRTDVRQRDRDLCRYCGVRTVWGTSDRRSGNVGEIDHVDPMDFTAGPRKDGNSMANCVVACKDCNVAKGQRTPEQWVEEDPVNGRLLLPAPGRYRPTRPGTDPERSSTDPAPIQHRSRTDPELETQNPGRPSRDARVGAGTDRGLIGARSGPDQGVIDD